MDNLDRIKERIQRGEVRLRKGVVTENKTVEVPVTREELVVERVPVSGQEAANAGEIGSDKENTSASFGRAGARGKTTRGPG